MSALIWYWAVPAWKLAEASSPLMVRHGNSAPRWLSSRARSRARSSMLCRKRSRFPSDPRLGVRQQRQDIDLGVPEVVALIARSGLALGRDADPFGPPGRLGHLVEVPPDGLLEPHRVDPGLHADVGAVPEAVQMRTLAGQELIEPVAEHAVQGPAAPSDELRHRDTA